MTATGCGRRCRSRGAGAIGEQAAECLRIESGRPRYGLDLDDTVIPQEAGLNDRAVSFTKGCYVGQETVARLFYKGRPNRHLRGLRLSAAGTPRSRAAPGRTRGGTGREQRRVPRPRPDRAGARAPRGGAGEHAPGRRRRRHRGGGRAPVPRRARPRLGLAAHRPFYTRGLERDSGDRPATGISSGRRARRPARDDGGLGDPRGALRRAQGRVPDRGDRSARARRLRGDRARDGGRGQLQQRVGGTGQAGVGDALRRPPAVRPPHRRLGRLRDRLEGRRRGHPLEAGRRSRRALQPGLLRGSRGPRPRSAGGSLAGDLGLRDDLGLLRPVRQGPGPAAAAQAPRPDVGGGRFLRARVLHRLEDADHPLQTAGRQQRPDLGRGGRPRGVRHPDLQGRRRQLRRGRVLGREG